MGEAFSWIEKHSLDRVHVLQMNAEHMGFPNDSFDLALCGFMGWEYCFDFARGEFIGPDLRTHEIARVLGDGGRMGISTWEKQDDLDWMEEAVIRHWPSILSDRDFVENRPIGYSREGPEGYDTILRSAGFQDIQVFREEVEFVSTDEEAWWEQMQSLRWSRFLEKMEGDAQQRLKEGVFQDLQHHKHADGIHFTKRVAFIFGIR